MEDINLLGVRWMRKVMSLKETKKELSTKLERYQGSMKSQKSREELQQMLEKTKGDKD